MKTCIKDCRYGRFLLIQGDTFSNDAGMDGEWSQAAHDFGDLARGVLVL